MPAREVGARGSRKNSASSFGSSQTVTVMAVNAGERGWSGAEQARQGEKAKAETGVAKTKLQMVRARLYTVREFFLPTSGCVKTPSGLLTPGESYQVGCQRRYTIPLLAPSAASSAKSRRTALGFRRCGDVWVETNRRLGDTTSAGRGLCGRHVHGTEVLAYGRWCWCTLQSGRYSGDRRRRDSTRWRWGIWGKRK